MRFYLFLASIFLLFSGVCASAANNWSSLKITWPKFTSLPTTVNDAVSAGWIQISKCGQDGALADRFILNNDPAVMLLFNGAGQISGFQVGTYNRPGDGTLYPRGPFAVEPNFNGTNDLYTVSAFSRDPYSLCNRAAASSPIGDGLAVRMGNSSDFLPIPLTAAEVSAPGQPWIKGKCFASMGLHYWFNFNASTPCDEMFPMFLLFNGGVLNGFGWLITKLPQETSAVFEHPPQSALKAFLPDDNSVWPTCLFKDGLVLSTQHLYFTQPLRNFC